jgi:hypothetical protein
MIGDIETIDDTQNPIVVQMKETNRLLRLILAKLNEINDELKFQDS